MSIITAQFTEDVLATTPTKCDRLQCSAMIPVGGRRHYITSPNLKGKFVCTRCFHHYLGKNGTTIREAPVTSGLSGSAPRHSHTMSFSERIQSVDIQSIRQSVNGAQRKNATQESRRILAVPQTLGAQQSTSHSGPRINGNRNSMMPPPPNLPAHPRSTLPNVGVPSAWPSYAGDFSPSSSTPSALGYTASHGYYQAERERWSKVSYQSMMGETVSISLQVLHEVPGKTKAALVENLHEGKTNIPACVTPKYLRHELLTVMKPKLEETRKGFEFDWTTIVAREIPSWVDLSAEDQDKPYFYERCLVVARGKDKKKVFKKPSKPFVFALVIDANQWERYTEFLAAQEVEEQENTQRSDSQADHNTTNTQLQLRLSSLTEIKLEADDLDWGNDEIDVSKSDDEIEIISPRSFNATSIKNGRTQALSPSPFTNQSGGITSAHKRQRSALTTSLIPTTPKRPRPQMEYISPDHKKFREALFHGGSLTVASGSAFSGLSERIEFFPILRRPLEELLANKTVQSFTYSPENARPGTLSVKHLEFLGVGAFKTAHQGRLCLLPLSEDGLGTTLNELVAVKRMYYQESTKKQGKRRQGVVATENINQLESVNNGIPTRILRYTPQDELTKMINEGNVIYWPNSLMDFTYTFIDSTIASAGTTIPFSIPRLRFVHAGLAIVHDQPTGKLATTAMSMRHVYLIEEFIDESREEFVKYIHNSDAVPLIEEGDSLYELAQFLSFVQHVQYSKSGEQVYISDLQGAVPSNTNRQFLVPHYYNFQGVELYLLIPKS